MPISRIKLFAFFVILLTLLLVPRYSVYAVDEPTARAAAARGDINLKIATFDQRISGMKDRIASREAEIKIKFEKFRDQVKAEIALRINTNLNLVNQNQTAALNKNLDTMSGILDRVVTKAGGTASTSAQVVAARSAITVSRTAIVNQALKDYTINISTESAIRKDVQAVREKLHTDLKNTRQTVFTAKGAILIAIRSILAPNASSSASPSAKVKESTATGLPVSN